jgi:integrase
VIYRALLEDPRNPLDLKETTQREYLRQLQPEGRLVQVFGSAKLHQVKPHMIGDYLDRHPASVAANREIALFSKMYRYAMRKGWAVNNPCSGIERNKERPRSRYVQDWEFAAVRAIASPVIQIAMDIALLTGLRLGDILRIQRKDYDCEELRVGESKTDTKVRFTMTDTLYAALDVHKHLRGNVRSLYVVHNTKGRQYTDSGFKSNWQKLMRRAVKEKVIKERFTFHDLRAKHATDKDEERLNAQLALGHATPATTKAYLRHPLGRKVRPLK